jgi:iron complex transport system substrate-binding protein
VKTLRTVIPAALGFMLVAGVGRAAKPAAFPVTARDALGRRVTVRAEPKRIVSLAPAMTEVLFALGLGDRIVGVTDYCNYPPAARSKAKVGGIVNPSVERVLALKPQLVIGMRLNPKPVLRALSSAGVPTFAAEPRTIEEVFTTITTVGALTGRKATGARLADDLRSRLQSVRAQVHGLPEPSVVFICQQSPVWVAGADTFPDRAIHMAGGRNIAAGVKGYKQYDVEMLVARDPDVILLTSMGGGDPDRELGAFVRRPSMRDLTAVKKSRVYVVDADIVDRAGPRIVEAVEEIAARLHPGRFTRR